MLIIFGSTERNSLLSGEEGRPGYSLVSYRWYGINSMCVYVCVCVSMCGDVCVILRIPDYIESLPLSVNLLDS